ncbi:acyloxyacyl hydrolase [Aeromonas taiwanensis]|uniref:acyloxyacyl hydrolase n=1 Tax=Aeromonas taiwanensis TaxID=633417 RepID=UPI003F742789
MDVKALLIVGWVGVWTNSSSVHADDNIMALQLGTPAESEKLDIFTVDVKYHHMFWHWGDSGCQLGLGGRGGLLDVGHEEGARLGAGARAECLWGNWVVWMPFEVLWLSKYEFGHRGNGFKDYGGPVQLSTGLGVGYVFHQNWMIGYQYEHMSNGKMYDSNPSLDSHTLHIEYRF